MTIDLEHRIARLERTLRFHRILVGGLVSATLLWSCANKAEPVTSVTSAGMSLDSAGLRIETATGSVSVSERGIVISDKKSGADANLSATRLGISTKDADIALSSNGNHASLDLRSGDDGGVATLDVDRSQAGFTFYQGNLKDGATVTRRTIRITADTQGARLQPPSGSP